MKLPRNERRRLARCDRIWSDKIKIRDKHSCQICGITNGASIESAHVIPRTFMETRHDMKNGIALCYLHHKVGMFSLHNNPLWFYECLKENNKGKLFFRNINPRV